VSSLGNIFSFYKTRHILLADSANCTVLRAVVLTQHQSVMDRRTDGIAVASTALAMRALRRAVKTNGSTLKNTITRSQYTVSSISIGGNFEFSSYQQPRWSADM